MACFPPLSVVYDPKPTPHHSLQAGQWVKLICGASYHDMPTIRRLAMLYALAGVDCVDVAADMAVVAAVRQGLADAQALAQRWARNESLTSTHDLKTPSIQHYLSPDLPWLMVSLNDSEDPHFRKAYFEPSLCPPDCHRPCETLCPTQAIQFADSSTTHSESPDPSGVIPNLCYGCGRCMAVCPVQNIVAESHQARLEDFPAADLGLIDAVEIHTQAGRQREFAALWQRLEPWRRYLKLVSISCPDDPHIEAYLQDLYTIMAPLEIPLIWQTDGRPMSGDLGKGTTHATIRLAQKVLAANLPGYVQLAGGTNGYTAAKLRELGLVGAGGSTRSNDSIQLPTNSALITSNHPHRRIAGIAYGSYARTLVMPILEKLEPILPGLLESKKVEIASPLGKTSHPEDVLDKTDGLGQSPKSESISTIDSTDDLKVAINQARQLVGALKTGGETNASGDVKTP